VWAHPDLLPTSADLDDPLGFHEGSIPAAEALTDAEFDAALVLVEQGRERGDDPDRDA